MSKEQKARATEENPGRGSDDGGGMNTGVAVIGFVVCFVAGAGLMWGYDAHNGVSKHEGSRGRLRRRVERQRLAHRDRQQGPDVGQPHGARHHGRVRGLPVSVLHARADDPASAPRQVRPERSAHRLEEQSPALPSERSPGRRRRSGRLRSGRERRVLEIPRHRLHAPVGHDPRQPRALGRRSRRLDVSAFTKPASRPTPGPTRSTRTCERESVPASRAPPPSSSTA